MLEEVFISIDIEADGPIPGDYSMISIGAVVAQRPEIFFYRELKPISEKFVSASLNITKLDRENLIKNGADPAAAMAEFEVWLRETAAPGKRPVFVAFNATFDWSFVNWYFIHFLGRNPFGISGLDIKALAMGVFQKPRWGDTTKNKLPPDVRATLPHTHNALDDAREQAEIFNKILARYGSC